MHTIHHRSIQSSAIETYKAVNNLTCGNLSEFFVRNSHNLRPKSELTVPSNTVFKGQNPISFFGSIIWNSLPEITTLVDYAKTT